MRFAFRIGWRRIGTGKSGSTSGSERTFDHVEFELAGIVFADRPAARRLARFVYRLPAPRDQIVPIEQGLARCPQSVGARLRKPLERMQILPVESHAVRDPFSPVFIIRAAPIAPIEEAASDVRRIEFAGFLILQLVDAAAAAAIAESFPLTAIQRFERPLPER